MYKVIGFNPKSFIYASYYVNKVPINIRSIMGEILPDWISIMEIHFNYNDNFQASSNYLYSWITFSFHRSYIQAVQTCISSWQSNTLISNTVPFPLAVAAFKFSFELAQIIKCTTKTEMPWKKGNIGSSHACNICTIHYAW